MDVPVGNSDRCFAVPVFFFIDRAKDIPVVLAGLVLMVFKLCRRRGDCCGGRPCALQRQVPAVNEFELKVPQIPFILCMPDIPVVLL